MKLIEALEIIRAPRSETGKSFVISLVCGFNPLHLQTFLDAELRRRFPSSRPEIRCGLYGDFWGNLDRVRAADHDGAVIILEWSDLDPRLGIRSLGSWAPSVLPELLESAKRRGALLESVLPTLAKDSTIAICLPSLPLSPAAFTPSWRASDLELGLNSLVAHLSAKLAQMENVRLVSPQRLNQLSPFADRLDVRSELMAGFPYQLHHASVLAELVSCLLGDEAPKKGLITDLDDTLWRGILGDVGSDGVSWDLDRRSHMHGLYQQLLHSLSQAGVLIGVASKNDPALVGEAFRREDMILPQDSIFPMEVHWGAKSESVSRILKAWNVGSDAIVFVDDSPAELAEVHSAHPQVECILFPTEEPRKIYHLLQQLRDLFGKSLITEEDAIRLPGIRHATGSQENRKIRAGSAESFLRQAEVELSLSFTKEPLNPRALELINKTNQFNLNGRRYTASEWQKYLLDPTTFLMLVTCRDKYGPLGRIAVITARQTGQTLLVDNWVMSCRAFGRRIEHKCLEELFKRYDVREIEFDFTATKRNGPIIAFLEEILGNAPSPSCRLLRQEFLYRQTQTIPRLEEADHG